MQGFSLSGVGGASARGLTWVAWPALLALLAALAALAALAGQSVWDRAVSPGSAGSAPGRSSDAQVGEPGVERAYAQLPLRFEPNRGQTDREVRFLSRGAGYSLFLTQREAVLSLTKGRAPAAATATVRIRPVGADPGASLAPAKRLPGTSNHLSGSDPAKWHTGVPGYERVRYRGIYPGIDLVYRGAQRKLEYDFVLAPGADPKRITLAMKGAERLAVDSHGDLVLRTAAGSVRQRRPFAYQRVGKARKRVHAAYLLEGKDRVGFSLGAYDRTKPLVIDPVLAYSTYLGGSGNDEGRGIAVDSSGTYLVGTTASTDFPTANPIPGASGGGSSDAFVTKLNPAGSALVYATYLGGGGADEGSAIAVDSSRAAYLTGRTTGSGFPTANPIYGGNAGGSSDAFVTKLSASGSLVYSTYLGGNAQDDGNGIAVDSSGAAYVTGTTFTSGATFSSSFPITPLAAKPVPSGRADAFVTKVNSSGSALAYSSFLGGSWPDSGYGIAVDSAGAAYATGSTGSPDFPVTPNAAQPDTGGINGTTDAYVTKFSADGRTFDYSTYLGGSGSDDGRGIALDPSRYAYVTGYTNSTGFPTASALQPSTAGGGDAFVSKLNPAAAAGSSSLVYSTYLGGSSGESGSAIAVDSAGSAYVTGYTYSSDFPTESPVQRTYAGRAEKADAFVTKLDPSGTAALAYSTFLGGEGVDAGSGIALDSSANAYVTGNTDSPDFPTARPKQATRAGGNDVLLTKIGPGADLSITTTDAPDPVEAGQPLTYTLTIQNAGPDTARGVSLRDELPGGAELVSASSDCAEASRVVTCAVGDLAGGASAQRQITVRPGGPEAALSNTATVESQTFDPVSANNSDTATTEVSAAATPPDTSADLSIAIIDNPDPVQTGEQLTYTLSARNAGPAAAKDVVVRDELPGGLAFVGATGGCSWNAATRVVACELGELASEDPAVSREIVVRPTVPSPSLVNTATVQSAAGDPVSTNNAASATTRVRAVADLSIAMVDTPDPVETGRELTYTLSARNDGPDVADGVTLRDELPAGVSFASAPGCSHTAGIVTCELGELAAGLQSERRITVRPTLPSPSLSNTASVQSSAVDSDSSDDSATTTTEVRQAAAATPGRGGPSRPDGVRGKRPGAPGAPTGSARSCVKLHGGGRARRIGAARLGRTRKRHRAIFTGVRLRSRGGIDRYCVAGGGALRIGYPTARLTRTLARSQRRRMRGAAVLILTTSRYSISAITPGASVRALRRRLRGERRVRVGGNVWYLAPGAGSRLAFRTRGGRVREVGLADKRLTRSRRAAKRLLRAWEL